MKVCFGSHAVANGGIHMAALRAGRAGMSALQIFTAVPTYYNEKNSVRPERVVRFREALATAGIDRANVIAHAGYVLNLATHDAAKWQKSAAALTRELERSTLLGVGGVCFHPGSAGDGDRDMSVDNVARAMANALEKVRGDTRLFIENTAGAGRTMGRTAAEIGSMLGKIPAPLRPRAGYGLDTCHLYASGYEINRSPGHLAAILDEFEQHTGEAPAFFHLNDSEGELASNRDRHALIGEGRIGAEAFRWLLHDRRADGIPLILETPQNNAEIADDDDAPDALDVRMIALLRELSR